MLPGHWRRWGWVLGVSFVAGCTQEQVDAPRPAPPQAQALAQAQAPSTELFEAYIEPLNATILRAPQNTFRIGTWTSYSSWIKLVMLAPDGQEIKKGEVVGKFEFRGDQALQHVEDLLRRAQAEQEQLMLSQGEKRETLKTSIGLKGLEAQKAELDTQKEGLVSSRDLERFEIELRQAQFEKKADRQKLSAHTRSLGASLTYQQRRVKEAELAKENYHIYKAKFDVLAPHDGVVRHAFNSWNGRKVQQGDGMPSGKHFVSLAKDEALGAVFYIPEERFSVLENHTKFLVHSPSSDKTYPVTISRVDKFPQELGFLKENEELPNAREKVYVVYANFAQQPGDLSAGLELKVGLP